MKHTTTTCLLLFSLIGILFSTCQTQSSESIPTYRKWHTITLSFEGPATSESAEINPFLHYRLMVTFKHNDQTYTVPGFYAADGHAGETSADSGNVWQVHFVPDAEGAWTYQVSFRQDDHIAVNDDPDAGEPLAFDNTQGSFQVIASDKQGRDFRAKGRLQYVGERYLRFAETGAYFLKGGTDSPENLLAYHEFDGTYTGGDNEQRSGEAAPTKQLHQYQPHVQDWHEGDPTWQDGKGKGILGGLNYLASQGMNSIYFLTLNIAGDGRDVWPYTSYEERYRFDCSKLSQWENVFSHADSLGMMLHFVTQETENELLLDSGNLGIQRKLYYRELIARFAHHLAITWNMGEENGYAPFTPNAQNDAQRKDMMTYIKKTDPYQHFVALHTHAAPKERHEILNPLLGFDHLDGPSLQINPPSDVHEETRHWVSASGKAGKQWVVNLDEIGPHYLGVLPDDVDPDHDTIRYEALWGNLMAGGGGVEWYFGYQYPNNDLNNEDWRTRQLMWQQTRYALDFFHQHLPFWEMESADSLVQSKGAYCFAKPGTLYAIYLPKNEKAILNVGTSQATYEVSWYDPKAGGALQKGTDVTGAGNISLGNPPDNAQQDWVILVKKKAS